MRISSNTPTYKPSHSGASHGQDAQPKFAGKHADNWKKQLAVGVLALSSTQAASLPDKGSTSTSLVNAAATGLGETSNLVDQFNIAQEATHEELKRADVKRQLQKTEEQQAEEKYWEQKHALQKRDDDDFGLICKEPSGRVVLVNWWNTPDSSSSGGG